MKAPSIASQCLALSGLFEAELLLELMLRHWQHPFADDKDFRGHLLEAAAEALRASLGGEMLIDGVPPDQVNLVAAIWYAEWSGLQSGNNEHVEERTRWLESLKRAIPSCFCDQDRLK